ncbi:MAG: hypothetical protein JWM86_321 [Thermoleophilia bacterium]|nr:hypothetical protein [Thermoleophilia bacterium]
MDAAIAYRLARGAVWHLEVALPELEAVASGAARASELRAAAASHVLQAGADTFAHAGNQASLGAQLVELGARMRDDVGSPAAHISRIRALRHDAQAALDELAPRLTGPEKTLSLAPAAEAPRSELALVTSIADARRFRRVSDVQRAVHLRILRSGTIQPEPIRWVGGYGNGNGAMPMVRVAHPATQHVTLAAVHRPPTAQAAQEEFVGELTARAGVDHLFSPVARRADGSALVETVPGAPIWEQHVDSGDDIAEVMGRWYEERFPGLGRDAAYRAGQLDFDEAKTIDYITAQVDRNAGGALADRATGDFHFIDQGFAGRGELRDPLRPGMKSHLVGGEAGRGEVLPEAAESIAARLSDDQLAAAHDVLRRGPDGNLPGGHATALAEDASDTFLANMRARRDQVRTGSWTYEPIDLNANPLAHIDWLRSQGR